MNTIVFEQINHTHYKSITEIYNYYIRYSTATYHIEPLSEHEVIAHFEFSAKNTEAFIIKDNEETAGFCLLRPCSKKGGYKFTYEITIYLKPDYEQKGIGSKAVIFLEKVAK